MHQSSLEIVTLKYLHEQSTTYSTLGTIFQRRTVQTETLLKVGTGSGCVDD